MLGIYLPSMKFALKSSMKGFVSAQEKGKEIVLKWLNDYYCNDKKREKEALSKYDGNNINQFDIVLDKFKKEYKNDPSELAIDVLTVFTGGMCNI